MRKIPLFPLIILAIFLSPCPGLSGQDTLVYLFPGQGSDERLFKNLELPEGYDTVHVSYPVPSKGDDMYRYALRLLPEIDTGAPFVLLGVSLGGMICTELADIISPVHTILVSSAKTHLELPDRYTFNRSVPLNRIVPKGLIKASARILQGIVEPDRKHDKETFKSMLKEKDPLYLKRTVEMITHWKRTTYSERIVHIHGNNDHTIPVKNVKVDYLVEDGSHMMMITRAEEINGLIKEILQEELP